MDIQSIVIQLKQEAGRLDQAIAALAGLGPQPDRRGRPPNNSQAKPASSPQRADERGCTSQNRSCEEGLMGKAKRQSWAQETWGRLQEVHRSQADECSHAEEVVGVDEGALGGEEVGGLVQGLPPAWPVGRLQSHSAAWKLLWDRNRGLLRERTPCPGNLRNSAPALLHCQDHLRNVLAGRKVPSRAKRKRLSDCPASLRKHSSAG